jgi:hypothetical protein
VSSQAEKITKFEAACANLECEKESVTTIYRRLSEKHKMFTEKLSGRKRSLWKPMRQRLLNFKGG